METRGGAPAARQGEDERRCQRRSKTDPLAAPTRGHFFRRRMASERAGVSERERSVPGMNGNSDIEQDLGTIALLLDMLPPITSNGSWWDQWGQIDESLSIGYLHEKLWLISDTLWPGTGDARPQINKSAWYTLVFFDNPDLYKHFDDLGPGTVSGRGGIGKRWSRTLCAAAGRGCGAPRQGGAPDRRGVGSYPGPPRRGPG